MTRPFEPTVFPFDDIDWVNERKEPVQAPKLIEVAEKTGARRKRIAQGEAGVTQMA